MGKRIDLHIHTTCSDGALSPKEIIDEAVKNNVQVIAIADHDTIDAYTNEVFDYANINGIELINAVEISTKNSKVGIHVLGYGFDLNDNDFKMSLSKIRNARHDYLYNVAEKLMSLGYKINVEELDKIDSVTKAHISLDVIGNEENKDLLLKNFNHIPNKGEFIETVMNEGCPAYCEKVTATPKEAADMIRKAGGKVVLAHPVAYNHEDGLVLEDIQNLIDDMKPDGVETYYLYVDRNDEFFNECEIWTNLAKQNGLFTTMGSDFHNKDGLRPEVGMVNDVVGLSDEEIDEIINNVKR